MKVARFFGVLFAVVGVVIMLAAVVLCFVALNSPVKILENPDGALLCSEQLQQYVNSGDFASAGQLMYGQPAFAAEETPDDAYTTTLWNAFRDSISFSYTSQLYLLDAELARDGVITVLDVPALMESMRARVQPLLQKKLDAADTDAAVYDDNGNVRQEVVEQVLQEALQQALREDAVYVTRNVTVKLIRRDDRWWAVPDQTFLKTISGLAA